MQGMRYRNANPSRSVALSTEKLPLPSAATVSFLSVASGLYDKIPST